MARFLLAILNQKNLKDVSLPISDPCSLEEFIVTIS